jgi:hypothetical protein
MRCASTIAICWRTARSPRQYVVVGEDADYADRAWRTVLDNGGAVVWTATLYDVDAKSYFVVAFDRKALRVYRYGGLAGPFEIKVNLHGATGTVDVYVSPDYRDPWNPNVRTIGMGPFDYHQRVRYTIAKHVDPQGRIKLPKASRSAGW